MRERSKKQFQDYVNSKDSATKSNALDLPSISLPKGEGALNGFDEKVSVYAVNGMADFSMPLPAYPGRRVVTLNSVSYNSGGGNSFFDLKWNLNIESIKRKTDKWLLQYLDGDCGKLFLFWWC